MRLYGDHGWNALYALENLLRRLSLRASVNSSVRRVALVWLVGLGWRGSALLVVTPSQWHSTRYWRAKASIVLSPAPFRDRSIEPVRIAARNSMLRRTSLRRAGGDSVQTCAAGQESSAPALHAEMASRPRPPRPPAVMRSIALSSAEASHAAIDGHRNVPFAFGPLRHLQASLGPVVAERAPPRNGDGIQSRLSVCAECNMSN
jgi:hypothetical protein